MHTHIQKDSLQALKSSKNSTSPTQLLEIKPLIQLQAKWRCKTPSDLAYIRKYKPKLIKNVILSSIDYQNIKTRKLREILISTKSASSLNIQNYNGPETNKNLNILLSSTNRWKKLFFGYNKNEHENISIKKTFRLSRCQDLSVLEIVFHSNADNEKIFRHLSRPLRCTKKLKHLALDTSHCKLEGTDDMFLKNAALLKFKTPRYLSSFYVNFQQGIFTNELLTTFSSNLHRCFLLKTLTLDFTEISGSILPNIWSSFFQKAQNIKTLNLIHKTLQSPSLEGAQDLVESLSNLKNLTALSLDFTLLTEENYHPSLSFASIASLSKLKSLSFNLNGFKCENSQQLLTGLYQLKKLNFTCIHTNSNLLQGISQGLQHLPHLKVLILQIPDEEISDIGVISLSQKVPNLLYLKELLVDFRSSKLNSESIDLLTKSIKCLNLTLLSLVLGPPKSSPPHEIVETSPLIAALSNYKNLSGLCLDLSAFNLPTKEFPNFWKVLKELKKLSLLTLRFTTFTSNNEENLENFKSSLQEMKQLSSLRLFFQTEISQQEVRSLASGLENLRHLEILGLQFFAADQLDNESFDQLRVGLQKLSSLKELELGFHRKVELDRWAMLDFLEGFHSFKNIERLVFDYFGMNYIHGVGPAFLELKNNKTLRYFTSCIFNNITLF